MNIFISSDTLFEFDVLNQLEKDLDFNLTECKILTTDRKRDKPFISYALMKGLDFKVYSIQGYVSDEAIRNIALTVDKLYLYSNMNNHFYNRLFKYCDEIVYVGGEKFFISELRNTFKNEFDTVVSNYDKKKETFDYYNVYNKLVINRIKNLKRVEIKVNNLY